MAKDDTPPTWSQALSDASASIASAMASPDADVKFGLAIIGAISQHTQRKQTPQGGAGAGAPGGLGGAGGPAGSPAPPPGASPGMPGAGPAGGGAPNQQMKSQAAPGGPIPGGMSQGLGVSGDANNADELRRVLSDVAG